MQLGAASAQPLPPVLFLVHDMIIGTGVVLLVCTDHCVGSSICRSWEQMLCSISQGGDGCWFTYRRTVSAVHARLEMNVHYQHCRGAACLQTAPGPRLSRHTQCNPSGVPAPLENQVPCCKLLA